MAKHLDVAKCRVLANSSGEAFDDEKLAEAQGSDCPLELTAVVMVEASRKWNEVQQRIEKIRLDKI